MTPSRHGTTPVPVIVGAPPRRSGDMLGRWWRELTAVVAGLATLAGASWVIGRAFFVTRDEHTAVTTAIVRIESRLERIEQVVAEGHGDRVEIARSLADIRTRLTRIEAQQAMKR